MCPVGMVTTIVSSPFAGFRAWEERGSRGRAPHSPRGARPCLWILALCHQLLNDRDLTACRSPDATAWSGVAVASLAEWRSALLIVRSDHEGPRGVLQQPSPSTPFSFRATHLRSRDGSSANSHNRHAGMSSPAVLMLHQMRRRRRPALALSPNHDRQSVA